MKAAVLHQVGKPLAIEDIAIDKPGPREVLVKTAAAGVCHSDLHFVEGLYPYRLPVVLGHESAGVVEEVGEDVTYVEPGDHVITCLSAFCGHCEACTTGHPSICDGRETRRRRDQPPRLHQSERAVQQFANLSSFAEQMLIHEHALVKIRNDMPLDKAALVGCSVTTGVGAVHNTAKVEVGSTVAVIGCGGVGLSCINGAAIAGAGRIIAVDRVSSKLDLAREFGATSVVDTTQGDTVEQIKEMTGGGVHFAFEAVGLKQTTEQAFGMLRPGGAAIVIGMVPYGTKIEIHAADFLQEKKLLGCAMGSNRFRVDMPRYVDFYLAGRLKLDNLVAKHIKLDQVNDALDELKTGEVARSVILFDS